MAELLQRDGEGITRWRPERPSERTEFEDGWCERCTRDVLSPCPIRALTDLWPIHSDRYPSAWRVEDGRPVCTEFRSNGGLAPRCSLTGDLFGGTA